MKSARSTMRAYWVLIPFAAIAVGVVACNQKGAPTASTGGAVSRAKSDDDELKAKQDQLALLTKKYKAERDALEEQIKAAGGNTSDQETLVLASRQQIESDKAQVEAKRKELLELGQQLLAKQSELEAATARLDGQKGQVADFDKQKADLQAQQTELNATKDKLVAAQKALEEAQKALAAKESTFGQAVASTRGLYLKANGTDSLFDPALTGKNVSFLVTVIGWGSKDTINEVRKRIEILNKDPRLKQAYRHDAEGGRVSAINDPNAPQGDAGNGEAGLQAERGFNDNNQISPSVTVTGAVKDDFILAMQWLSSKVSTPEKAVTWSDMSTLNKNTMGFPMDPEDNMSGTKPVMDAYLVKAPVIEVRTFRDQTDSWLQQLNDAHPDSANIAVIVRPISRVRVGMSIAVRGSYQDHYLRRSRLMAVFNRVRKVNSEREFSIEDLARVGDYVFSNDRDRAACSKVGVECIRTLMANHLLDDKYNIEVLDRSGTMTYAQALAYVLNASTDQMTSDITGKMAIGWMEGGPNGGGFDYDFAAMLRKMTFGFFGRNPVVDDIVIKYTVAMVEKFKANSASLDTYSYVTPGRIGDILMIPKNTVRGEVEITLPIPRTVLSHADFEDLTLANFDPSVKVQEPDAIRTSPEREKLRKMALAGQAMDIYSDNLADFNKYMQQISAARFAEFRQREKANLGKQAYMVTLLTSPNPQSIEPVPIAPAVQPTTDASGLTASAAGVATGAAAAAAVGAAAVGPVGGGASLGLPKAAPTPNSVATPKPAAPAKGQPTNVATKQGQPANVANKAGQNKAGQNGAGSNKANKPTQQATRPANPPNG